MRNPSPILSITFGIFLLSTAANAGDRKLTDPEIRAALSDHTLQGTGEDGKTWQQVFQESGATFYSVGSAQSQGQWTVRGDQYCSQWPPNESWACYDMAEEAGTYVFISASGRKTAGTVLN